MALTKVQKTGITDNAIDADKIEDGTIVAADIAPGTITNAKLAGSIANDKLANSSITVNGSSVSLGGSVSAGKVQWQTVKTTDFNAVAGEGYFVDTNSVGAVTATLPGSPSAGDTIAFKDYAANFGTNSLTIARNGNNIQGVANDSQISTNRASVVLVYIDATKGWLFTNESNVADLEKVEYISATGGTITTSGDFKIHSFTGDGCFVVSTGGNPAGSDTVDYLVVAGGGGGFGDAGGGGGAGGFRVSNSYGLPAPTMSPLATPTGVTVTATTYPITVGGGGSAPSGPGSNSVFSTITSTGGGGANSNPGGSGGGSRANAASAGGSGNTPPVSPPQGNDGGIGPPAVYGGGAGGGGAGGTGTPAPTGAGGNGGVGSYVSPSLAVGCAGTTGPVGSTRYFSGGGGGSKDGPTGPVGSGGAGGGGDAQDPGTGNNGSANTGGGAGGGSNNPAGAGGSGGKGIIILRYKFQN